MHFVNSLFGVKPSGHIATHVLLYKARPALHTLQIDWIAGPQSAQPSRHPVHVLVKPSSSVPSGHSCKHLPENTKVDPRQLSQNSGYPSAQDLQGY